MERAQHAAHNPKFKKVKSGTNKPDLLAKILATNFNVFFVCVLFINTVDLLWKGQECLTTVGKFGTFPHVPCTILYKSCLFYSS